MNQRWFKRIALAVLMLSVVTASCDTLPTEQVSTIETSSQLAPSAAVVSGYSLVPSAPTTSSILDVLKLIGPLGGSLGVVSHSVNVPMGAVLLPTLFTMRVERTGHIEVELHALLQTALGLVDVGGDGFRKPVTLSLSYKTAIGVTDPTRLRIALLDDDGTIAEILPTTLDRHKKVVSAELPHFSRYAIVAD